MKPLVAIVGRPNVGKSTLLKKIAALSEKNGFTTDRIHCSSSPTSLDGVIIGEKRIAVIDGGRIVACDTHENLLEYCREYVEIYSSQMKSGSYVEGGAANE